MILEAWAEVTLDSEHGEACIDCMRAVLVEHLVAEGGDDEDPEELVRPRGTKMNFEAKVQHSACVYVISAGDFCNGSCGGFGPT